MKKLFKVISIITLLMFLRTNFAPCAEQVYFYYPDPAGTPLAMSDASGTVVWRANYLPFGEEMIDLSTVQNNKMFVGKEKDSESGLYYFGARYMDPGAGRFTAIDPIGPVDPMSGKLNAQILANPQRLNRYAYALNNPYRYFDPNGLWSISFDAYAKWGAGITIGKGEGQPFFMSFRAGAGLGAGFSIDPNGKSPSNSNAQSISDVGSASSVGLNVLGLLNVGPGDVHAGTSSFSDGSTKQYFPTQEEIDKPMWTFGLDFNSKIEAGGYVAVEGTLYPGNIVGSLSSGTTSGAGSQSYNNIPGQD